MIRSSRVRAVVCLALVSLLIAVVPANAENTEALSARLQKTVNLPKGIETNTPLKDALDRLASRWNLDLQVDAKLFKKRGAQDVENQPVSLPRLLNVRLATVLDLVARQVDGSCVTLKERIVIVPRSRAGSMKVAGYRPFPVVATKGTDTELRAKLDKAVSFDKASNARVPLAKALDLLADHCQVNIVIDEVAFRAIQTKDVTNQSVELAKIDKERFSDVLDKICSQAKSRYRVQDNIIWIIPAKS